MIEMMPSLAGTALDHFCGNCKRDSTLLVTDELGSEVLATLNCCGAEVSLETVTVLEFLTAV